MKNLLNIIFNGIFLFAVIIIAVAISTLAITKKINDNTNQYAYSLSGSVVKKAVPIISFTKGLADKVYVQTGDEVKKGELLVKLINPPLVSELEALKEFPDNVSAQTQVKVYEQQLKLLTISSPVDGIIGEVNITEGSAVDAFTKLLTMYSNHNIQFLAYLTIDQFQAVRHSKEVRVYSERLNQSFIVIPDVVNPNAKTPVDSETKKIGLFFKFKNNKDAVSLLNNEDLMLQLEDTTKTDNFSKPVDLIVNFWNNLLPAKR